MSAESTVAESVITLCCLYIMYFVYFLFSSHSPLIIDNVKDSACTCMYVHYTMELI